jgi:hypothetical protein
MGAGSADGGPHAWLQVRNIRLDGARLAAVQRGDAPHGVLDSSGPLGERQLAMVRAADIFFLATSAHRPGAAAGGLHSGSSSQPHMGCDVSHRGGPPGFVEVAEGGRTLRWPDYRGNNFYMSLGQLLPGARVLPAAHSLDACTAGPRPHHLTVFSSLPLLLQATCRSTPPPACSSSTG